MKTIYYHAAVYTGQLPLQQAFIVEGDKFTFVGSDANALARLEPGDTQVDLAGRFVCAGFNDSHMHLLGYGNALLSAPLAEHTGSLEEMLCCLREHLDRHPVAEDEWLLGRGWNQDYFTDACRFPTRLDLDTVSDQVPICAVRACGHALVVNSKALRILGITPHTPQPEGGRFFLDTGVFLDNAMDLVYAAIPAPDREGLKRRLRAACAAMNAYGITSCQSDDYCAFRTIPWKEVDAAYRELEAAGELTLRVNQQANFTDLPSLQAYVQAGNITGTGTEHYRCGPLKMLGDGALGARTAYLSRPYADDPTTRGICVFTQEVFDEMIGYANEQGMQVAIHAIGDACLDMVLHSLEQALAQHPRRDHRHGIVHCQISRPDQLQRLGNLGLHIYAQSIFLDYDIHIVRDRVGEELAQSSYSWKTLQVLGASVSNGSDCPVEKPDVLAGIQCAVTRKTLRGEGPYLQAEGWTVQEALDSFTSAGAYASFEESSKGKIRPGMLADFVVLGEDPFRVEENRIREIPVLATYLAGQKVYEK